MPAKFVLMLKPGFERLSGELEAAIAPCARILARRELILSSDQAARFYLVHKERPFYGELVAYMSSGKVTAYLCEGSVECARKVIGATNPALAEEGTIRKRYGKDVQRNVAHCSDSGESGLYEASVLFPDSLTRF